MFEGREHAANLLAQALMDYAGKNPLSLSYSARSRTHGKIYRRDFRRKVDVVLVRKLGHPINPNSLSAQLMNKVTYKATRWAKKNLNFIHARRSEETNTNTQNKTENSIQLGKENPYKPKRTNRYHCR